MGCVSSSEYEPSDEEIKDFAATVSAMPNPVKLKKKVFRYYQLDRDRVANVIENNRYDTGAATKEEVISYLYSLDYKNGKYEVNEERHKDCKGHDYNKIADTWYIRRLGSGTRLQRKTEDQLSVPSSSQPSGPYGQPVPPHMQNVPPRMQNTGGYNQPTYPMGNQGGYGAVAPSAPPLGHY